MLFALLDLLYFHDSVEMLNHQPLWSVCPRTPLFVAQYLGKHVPADSRQRGRDFSEASSHGQSQEPLQLPKEISY